MSILSLHVVDNTIVSLYTVQSLIFVGSNFLGVIKIIMFKETKFHGFGMYHSSLSQVSLDHVRFKFIGIFIMQINYEVELKLNLLRNNDFYSIYIHRI